MQGCSCTVPVRGMSWMCCSVLHKAMQVGQCSAAAPTRQLRLGPTVKLRDTLQLLLVLGSALASLLLLQVQMLTVPFDVAATNCSGLHEGINTNGCSSALSTRRCKLCSIWVTHYKCALTALHICPCVHCTPQHRIENWTLDTSQHMAPPTHSLTCCLMLVQTPAL
jgi:hypothetical protein